MAGPPVQPGTIIGGKYRLDLMLGKGGMGSVYAAENLLTGKRVAIKCMNAELMASEEATSRFMREAKVSARIRHPNVVDVYDVLNEDGELYLIMELLEGSPLSEFLSTQTVPLPNLIELLIAAMRGVAAAHRQGVVHRDVKPENIFLAIEGDDPRWVPKVLDFGISKVQGTQEIAITAPGAALGTLLYMATEQLNGAGDVDARADVYAFGVILYQAITGRFPFFADTVPALVVQIFTVEPTPVKQLRHDVPAKLGELVSRAMARSREQRMQSLDELIQELLPFADQAKYGQWLTRTSSKPVVVRTPSRTQVQTERPPAPLTPPPIPPRRTVRATQPSTETPFAASIPSRPRVPARARAVWAAALGVIAIGVCMAVYRGLSSEAGTATLVQPATVPSESREASEAALGVPERDPGVSSTRVGPSTVEPAPAGAPAPSLARSHPPAPGPSQPGASPGRSDAVAPAGSSTAANGGRATPSVKPKGPASVPVLNRRSSCEPNFYLDEQGDKHFKPECF